MRRLHQSTGTVYALPNPHSREKTMHQSEQETHTRDTAVAMGNLTSATSIREALHSTLKVLENINECALVDYPQYPNVGSHLLWLSEVMYLTEVMNIKIKYLSTLRRYSDSDMQDAIGDQPILLRSGYLGDFWDGSHGDRRRLIYEHIIGHFTNNPIYIMPQSINYRDPAKLDNAKRIINLHPNVTIIARANDGYNFAK
jgi:pyruvyl transferase EpsO